MTIRATQQHPECPWCARLWFQWFKARVERMARTGATRRRAAVSTSFAEAAATSVRPESGCAS